MMKTIGSQNDNWCTKKKNVDDQVKDLEEQLIQYCRENDLSIESVTQGQYNVKPNTGRKLKKK